MLPLAAMLQRVLHRAADAALRVVALLRLRRLVRWTFLHLPRSARRDLGLLQVRLGLMDGLLKVDEERLRRSLRNALEEVGPARIREGAAYLEFGVYVGTSMAVMHHAAADAGAADLRLIGFDSFEGMPAGDDSREVESWEPGQLYSDVRLTRANLRRLGVPRDRVQLVRGYYEDSLTERTRERLGVSRAAVVMFDCVLESSTLTALEWCTPLLADGAIAYFDDWNVVGMHDRGMGESEALRKWLAAHPEMEAVQRDDLSYGSETQAFLLRPRPAPSA